MPPAVLPKFVRHLILLWPLLTHGASAPNGDARALVDASQVQIKIDPERSRQYAEQALQVLATRPDTDLQMRAHLLLCDYHAERSPEIARQQIATARTLLPQLKRRGLEAGLISCEGDLFENTGDNRQAFDHFDRAARLAEREHDPEMTADALYKRGYLRGMRGELTHGLIDLKQAQALYEQLSMPNHALTAGNGIAILYNRMGDFAQARSHYEATLKAEVAAGLLREQVITQYNLGRALENLKDWDAAQAAFEKVRKLSGDLNFDRGHAYSLRGLASVQNARGAPAAALQLLDQVDQMKTAVPDARLHAQVQQQRGIALRLLHRPEDSAVALKAALDVFRQAESLSETAAIHNELALTLADATDWRGALEQHQLFKADSDKLLQLQLDERFATQRFDYDKAARNRELRLSQQAQAAAERALEQQRLASRWLTLAIALAIALVAVLATLLVRHRRTSSAMRKLAMTDELTQLPNRRAALAEIEVQLGRAHPSCALLIGDIDLFKAINDTHGHLVGDQILRGVGQVVRSLGENRLAEEAPLCLARFGGEEFVAVLPGASLDQATAVAERLRAGVEQIDVSRWTPGRCVTISIGVTLAQPNDTVSTLLRRADEALYAAKGAGRNRVRAHAVDLQARTEAAVSEAVSSPHHASEGLRPAMQAP